MTPARRKTYALRNDDRAARARIDVDARALADEIVAEPFDVDVGDHAPALDFGIDDAHAALAPLLVGAFAEAARSDEDLVAGAHELGVPFGQLQAQDVAVFGERGDRFARHHDAPFRDGNGEDAPGGRRENGAFAHLLGDDAAVAAHRLERALGDVERGAGRVDLNLRADAAALQFLDAIEIGLGLVGLRGLGLDARIERLHLKQQLRVGDRRQLCSRDRAVALLRLQRNDRAADARARDELMDRLDRGDDRLLILDLGGLDDETLRGSAGLRRPQGHRGEEVQTAHRMVPDWRLDTYMSNS